MFKSLRKRLNKSSEGDQTSQSEYETPEDRGTHDQSELKVSSEHTTEQVVDSLDLVLTHLFKIEERYVTLLQSVVKNYVKPLVSFQTDTTFSGKIAQLCLEIEAICDYHQSHFQQLQEICKDQARSLNKRSSKRNLLESSQEERHVPWNETIEKFIAFFDLLLDETWNLYMNHIEGFRNSIVLINDACLQNTKFNSSVEKLSSLKEFRSMNIAEALYRPIKQLSKYHSVFRRISKLPSVHESDYKQRVHKLVSKWEEKIKDQEIKAKIKACENIVQVFYLQRHLFFSEGESQNIVFGSRMLKKQGVLQQLTEYQEDPEKKQEVFCFLFNDILLLASKHHASFGSSRRLTLNLSSSSSPQRRMSITDEDGLPSTAKLLPRRRSTLSKFGKRETSEFFSFVGLINFRNAILVNITDSVKDTASKNLFQLLTSTKQYTFETQHTKAKHEWMKQIDLLINCTESDIAPEQMTDHKITEREWQLLLTNATQQILKKDEVIASEGNVNAIYKLISGTVRIEKNLSRQVVLSKIEEGQVFGDFSFLGKNLEPVSFVADAEVKVITIKPTILMKILKAEPIIAMKFYKNLAANLSHRMRTAPSAYKLVGDVKNEGIVRFQANPIKGIAYLIEEGFLSPDPKSIAKFLKDTPKLDKQKLGEYLGDREERCKEVLRHYLDTFSFVAMHIDNALRLFLSAFLLPGEAQKIDRMMEQFARKFFVDNPVGFADQDAVYILSFSIIMLATDLHNPSIKNKMTKLEWLKNNQGNNGGQDYDKQFLLDIYDRISQERLKLKDEEYQEQAPIVDTKQQQDENFQRRFQLSTDEIIIKEFSCTLKRAGQIYVSAKHVCFFSKIFGIKEKKKMAFRNMVSVKQENETSIVIEEQTRRKVTSVLVFENEEVRQEISCSVHLLQAFSLISNIWETVAKEEGTLGGVRRVPTSDEILSTSKSKLAFVTELPTEEDWNLLLKRAKYLTFKKDSKIVEEGDVFQRIYQIVKGQVRIEKSILAPNKARSNQDLKPSYMAQEKMRIQFLFEKFDLDHNGVIDRNEFANVTAELGEKLSTEDQEYIFNAIDLDKDGGISFDEFYTWWCSATNPEVEEKVKKLAVQMKKFHLKNIVQNISSNLYLPKHQNRVLAFIGVGEVFGEISFIEGGGASASVVADTDVEVFVMEGPTLGVLFEWKPELGAKFYKYLATVLEKRLSQREKSLFDREKLLRQN